MPACRWVSRKVQCRGRAPVQRQRLPSPPSPRSGGKLPPGRGDGGNLQRPSREEQERVADRVPPTRASSPWSARGHPRVAAGTSQPQHAHPQTAPPARCAIILLVWCGGRSTTTTSLGRKGVTARSWVRTPTPPQQEASAARRGLRGGQCSAVRCRVASGPILLRPALYPDVLDTQTFARCSAVARIPPPPTRGRERVRPESVQRCLEGPQHGEGPLPAPSACCCHGQKVHEPRAAHGVALQSPRRFRDGHLLWAREPAASTSAACCHRRRTQRKGARSSWAPNNPPPPTHTHTCTVK